MFKRNKTQLHPEYNQSDLIKIGMIVEKVNSTEMRINNIIINYYADKNKKEAFLNDFMFAGRLRLNDKLKIFKSVLKRKNIGYDDSNIENWIKIRNMVAHGIPVDNNAIVFNGNFYNIEGQFSNFKKLQLKMDNLLYEAEK